MDLIAEERHLVALPQQFLRLLTPRKSIEHSCKEAIQGIVEGVYDHNPVEKYILSTNGHTPHLLFRIQKMWQESYKSVLAAPWLFHQP
jgi:hypothetical protein